jgi:hypothetical protein
MEMNDRKNKLLSKRLINYIEPVASKDRLEFKLA